MTHTWIIYGRKYRSLFEIISSYKTFSAQWSKFFLYKFWADVFEMKTDVYLYKALNDILYTCSDVLHMYTFIIRGSQEAIITDLSTWLKFYRLETHLILCHTPGYSYTRLKKDW